MTKLIIVSGFPASGKTTLVTQLSKDLNLPSFSKDDFKELLADTIGFTDHESTRPFGKTSFSALFLVAKRLIENKASLIIEGNFMMGDETKEFLSYLRQADVEVYEILCHAEGQVLIDRFMARKRHPVHHTLDEVTLNHYLETSVRKGKDVPLGVGKLLEVDTTEPAKVSYDGVLAFVSRQ
jgi:predicted kinase